MLLQRTDIKEEPYGERKVELVVTPSVAEVFLFLWLYTGGAVEEFLIFHIRVQKAVSGLLYAELIFQFITQCWVSFCALWWAQLLGKGVNDAVTLLFQYWIDL